jgi:hypothetical protein
LAAQLGNKWYNDAFYTIAGVQMLRVPFFPLLIPFGHENAFG